MEKVVVMFCKIEESFKAEDTYKSRKEQIPFFLNLIENIKNEEQVSKIVLSFISDKNMYDSYIANTEISMNMPTYDNNTLIFGKNFYNDFNYNPQNQGKCLLEKNNPNAGLMNRVISYVSDLSNKYYVEDIIFVYPEPIPMPNFMNLIVSSGGLKPLIEKLNYYIDTTLKDSDINSYKLTS